MNAQERHLVTGLLVLMLLLWAGFVWHRDPAFPGSFTGSMLGIAAAAFMFVPFVYLVIKRIKPLKKWVTRRLSMPKLLLWHIYAGIIGPILGLLHSAHRFDSMVGIAMHDLIKRWFKRWLKFHIVISCTLYALLIFHIAAEIYFGLRWL